MAIEWTHDDDPDMGVWSHAQVGEYHMSVTDLVSFDERYEAEVYLYPQRVDFMLWSRCFRTRDEAIAALELWIKEQVLKELSVLSEYAADLARFVLDGRE